MNLPAEESASRQQRLESMHHGEVKRTLFSLAVPGILSMLVTAAYNVVDTFFVGLLHDTAAMGATVVVFPLFLLIGAAGLTLGIGAASVISRRLGQKRLQDANIVASMAFFSCAGIGLALSAAGLLLSEPLFRACGATDTILTRAQEYGRIILAGSTFQMLGMCLANVTRAEGAARHSGSALVLGSLANVVLDPVLMFPLGLGLRGAAYATIASQALSLGYLLLFYLRRKGVIRLAPRFFSFKLPIYAQIMTVGVPALIQHLLIAVSLALVNNAAGRYGDAAVAGIGIQMRVTSLVIMTVIGLGQGFQPLAGYSYGARLFGRLRKALALTLGWGSLFTFLMSAAFAVFAPAIIRLFSKDPEVTVIGSKALRFASISLPFFAFQHAFLTLFQALGRGGSATLLALSRQGFLFIPAILLLPRLLGLNGVLLSQPAADTFALAMTAILGAMVLRRLRQEEQEGGSADAVPALPVVNPEAIKGE